MAEPSRWWCDSCGDVIADPNMALLVWRESPDRPAHGFKIVHKSFGGRSCDPGAKSTYENSLELSNFLGADGLSSLLGMFLSDGPLRGGGGCEVAAQDMDDFVDVVRRLQLPFYEEARRRFCDEDVREWASDSSGELYLQADMQRIAKGAIG